MRAVRLSVLLNLSLISFGAAPLLAASDYSEGWDAGTVAGWGRATIDCEVFGDASGGNPGGSLRIVPSNTSSIALIGALTEVADATGDYAAAGIRRVMFDLKNESVPVSALWFRVRYLNEFHNGWIIHLTSSVPQGSYTSYVVDFDPTWSDAEATAAGWQQESSSPSFAETMASVYYPSVQFRASPVTDGAQIRLDNFRLVSCSGDNDDPMATVAVDRASLWPPNHKLVDVYTTVQASDFCDPNPVVHLVSVTSNEPDEGLGNGDKPGDIEIVSDFAFRLRSERDTHGEGRVYTITYSVMDLNGNETKVSAQVAVPVSQSTNVLMGSGTAARGGALGREDLVLYVPSRSDGFDATKPFANAQVGNEFGTVRAARSYLLDVDGDRRDDLALLFPAAEVKDLADLIRAEALRDRMADPSWDGTLPKDGGPVSFCLYFEMNGTSYLAEDVLTPKRSVQAHLDTSRDDDAAAGDAHLVGPAETPGTLLLSIPRAGHLDVTLFSVLGRKVRTLVDRQVGAGSLPIAWDGLDDAGRPAPSGMYFARISGPGFHEVSRIQRIR